MRSLPLCIVITHSSDLVADEHDVFHSVVETGEIEIVVECCCQVRILGVWRGAKGQNCRDNNHKESKDSHSRFGHSRHLELGSGPVRLEGGRVLTGAACSSGRRAEPGDYQWAGQDCQ